MDAPLLANARDGKPAHDGGTISLNAPEPPPALAADGSCKAGIAVIGAGPSGLLTACLLKKAGKDVKVFEMRDRPTSFFGSFPVVLNKRGLTALAQLGPDLTARVKALGRPVDSLDIVNDNKTVASVGTFGVCIMRDQAVGLLLGVADELGVPIYWEHKLLDVDLEGRAAVFERGQGYGIEKLTVRVGQALVGADGNYSRVRRECESKNIMTAEKQDWGVRMRYILAPNPPASHMLPPTVDGRVHYVLGADGYVCQQPDGVWSLSFSITEKSDDFMLSDDPSPANIAQLKALCEAKATPFAKHLLTSDDIYASFFQHHVFGGSIIKCSTLAPADWIALIGDAAHAVAPFTGEGINSALESASILAATLRRVDGKNTTTNFDAARREDAHAAFAIALRNRKIVAGTRAQKCANTFSTVMLGIGKKLGCVSSTMQDWMLGAKAKEVEPLRYSSLLAMDRRQRCCCYPLGICCFYTFFWPCCGKRE